MRFNYSSCFATNGYCRLVLLFPKIDVNPADGYINEDELTDWNMQQAERDVMHRTQREMETHDKNKDGFVSFAEYEPPTWVRNSGRYPFFSFFFLFLLKIIIFYGLTWTTIVKFMTGFSLMFVH